MKEKKEDDTEKSEYVVVWKTQNPDEILLQNQDQAWLINLDKMEIRYEIGDDVKGQFAGYSQKENKVLMKNWLEEKYWICPLYTTEELKELGIIERVIPEPEPADPETLPEIAKTMENAMEEFIEAWTQLDGKTLAERRYERFRKF